MNLRDILFIIATGSFVFRLLPMSLQFKAVRKVRRLSLLFLLYLSCSFLADVISLVLSLNRIYTAPVFNVYQLCENTITMLIAFHVAPFKRSTRLVLTGLGITLNAGIIGYCILFGFNSPANLLWGLSKLYLMLLLSLASFLFFNSANYGTDSKKRILWAIAGIAIFESFTIIPLVSTGLQIEYPNSPQIFIIYFTIVLAGNVIRDVLLSIHGYKSIRA